MELDQIVSGLQSLQDDICLGLEQLDGSARFRQDIWNREGGGGGRTRVIQGDFIEKGGVNFSHVYGKLPKRAAMQLKVDPAETFHATGVSIVLHPKNPYMPIIHMNVRYFEMSDGRWWFGGGIDLTPHYIRNEDTEYFHDQLKSTCDSFHPEWYPAYKKWADEYFYIRHRKESRGVGGIFYDRLSAPDISKATGHTFNMAVGQCFLPIYTEMARRHREKPYGERELRWQSLRRSRYVEFNLVWDRGTKFGLETGGRTESILMSMPPQAIWVYDYIPAEGSPESETLKVLRSS